MKIEKKQEGVKQRGRGRSGGVRGRRRGVGCWQSKTERHAARKRKSGICAHQESSGEHKRLTERELGRRSWVKEEADRNSGRRRLRGRRQGVKRGWLKKKQGMSRKGGSRLPRGKMDLLQARNRKEVVQGRQLHEEESEGVPFISKVRL